MPGTKNLEACKALTDQLKRFYESGRLIGAICAAPQIFGHLGFLKNRKACIYPGMEAELIGAEVTYDPVTQSDNVITSRGMGTAIAFGYRSLPICWIRRQQTNWQPKLYTDNYHIASYGQILCQILTIFP